MRKTTFLIVGKHAVLEALKNPNRKISIISFLPNLEGLRNTSIFIRENIARLYYKLLF